MTDALTRAITESLTYPLTAALGSQEDLGESTYVFVSAEAQAWINALSTKPPQSTWPKLDTFFQTIKANTGIWNQLELLYLPTFEYNASATREINAKNPGTFNSTNTGIVRTPGSYITNDGVAGSKVDTGWDISVLGSHQDDVSVGFWNLNTAQLVGANMADNNAASGGRLFITPRNGSNTYGWRVNTTSTTGSPASTDASGHFTIARVASGTQRLYKNGVQISAPGAVSAAPGAGSLTFLQTATSGNGQIIAMYAGKNMATADILALHNAMNSLFLSTDVISELTINAFGVGRPYQQVGGQATITFTGTYTGTAEDIEMQFVDADTGAVVRDWTTVVTGPTGGTWSAPVTISASDRWLRPRPRKKTSGGALTPAGSFGVGEVIAIMGQSNGYYLFGNEKRTPLTANTKTRRFAGGNLWNLPNALSTTGETASQGGDGVTILTDRLQQLLGVVVGVVDLAIAGTSIASWSPTGAGSSYTASNTIVTKAGNGPGWAGIGTVLWNQGETDILDYTTYQGTLETLISDYRNIATAGQKWFIAILGPHADTGGDGTAQSGMRATQMKTIADNAANNVFWGYSQIDGTLADDVHLVTASYERMGRRCAQSMAAKLGGATYGSNGPKIISATCAIGSNQILVTVSHHGGTTLQDASGNSAATGMSGFAVTVDGTSRTVSAAVLESGRVRLTFSGAAAVSSASITYAQGYLDTGTFTKPVYDDFLPGGDSIGCPLQPTSGSITVTVA